jgi:hypothetical protein
MYNQYPPHQSPNNAQRAYYNRSFQQAPQAQQPTVFHQAAIPPHNAGSQFNTINSYNNRFAAGYAPLSSHQPQQTQQHLSYKNNSWGTTTDLGASGNGPISSSLYGTNTNDTANNANSFQAGMFSTQTQQTQQAQPNPRRPVLRLSEATHYQGHQSSIGMYGWDLVDGSVKLNLFAFYLTFIFFFLKKN